MKRSEKLFLAINEIDGDIVEEAKPEEEKPIQMKPEPRSPMKGIIALAACVAVLAVGIFTIVKFKLGGDIESVPVQNGSDSFASDSTDSEYNSSDTDSADNGSEIDPMLTEHDLELQAILKELVPKAEEIDGMFTHLAPSGDKYILNFDFANGFLPYSHEYYIVSEDQRTNNGLFAIPHSYDEMEKLVSEYFSAQGAEFYMKNYYHGTLTGSQNETLFVDLGQYGPNDKGFIEINGSMYYADWREEEYPGMGIDCETARITRQTDTVIEFTYFGRNYNVYNDVYSEKTGFLVKENGIWKLRYLCGYGFAPEIPTEYTEQDIELQTLLNGLKPGDEVTGLFVIGNFINGTQYNFAFPEITNKYDCHTYYDVSTLDWKRNSLKSCDEFEQRLLQYFTREATDSYMSKVCKGTMTTEDGVIYSVILDKDIGGIPIYVEIDGKMYCTWEAGHSEVTSLLCDTAKVIEHTDNTIIFSHAVADYENFHTKTERLVYERGGWKRDPFYQ